MLNISTAQFLGYPFSIIYDEDIHFSGFFDVSSLPNEYAQVCLNSADPNIAQVAINAYLENSLSNLPMPLNIKGTPFQQSVWRHLTMIPKGGTQQYNELALQIGAPKAYRAVGTACGKNPFSLIVPCHRVIGGHGLGGYRWGLNIKEALLTFETR